MLIASEYPGELKTPVYVVNLSYHPTVPHTLQVYTRMSKYIILSLSETAKLIKVYTSVLKSVLELVELKHTLLATQQVISTS